jgi:hypothetical protein
MPVRVTLLRSAPSRVAARLRTRPRRARIAVRLPRTPRAYNRTTMDARLRRVNKEIAGAARPALCAAR